MKKVLVLGGGGFIGGHLAKKLKTLDCFVRVVDLKYSEYFKVTEICDEFIIKDLSESNGLDSLFKIEHINKYPNLFKFYGNEFSVLYFDEVYQLAADMGGAGYIFTKLNDANVMWNSSKINLNIIEQCLKNNKPKIFYSSSACIYPEHNQKDPENPNCREDSAYPANPDSEYGWEKLFSERLFLAFSRNHNLDVRIARFHNIYGPQSTWCGGKEKSPAAICRKVAEINDSGEIEIWGNGLQTRSFLFIDDCVDLVLKFMEQNNFSGPVNIGSEEMVTINDLAQIVIQISGKKIQIKNIFGDEFVKKYGFECPLGVMGRNSHNELFNKKVYHFQPKSLTYGMEKTYLWINEIYNSKKKYESKEKNTK